MTIDKENIMLRCNNIDDKQMEFELNTINADKTAHTNELTAAESSRNAAAPSNIGYYARQMTTITVAKGTADFILKIMNR
jgi:hypothetical protein